MKVVVPREIHATERRVALVPDAVGRVVEAGVEVRIEAGAGERAGFPDEAYRESGAQLVPDAAAAYAEGDVVIKVRPPAETNSGARHEVEFLGADTGLIAFLDPLGSPELIRRLADARVTSFAMELIPRITRAQSMDALSSQATVAGYHAVLAGAAAVGKFFPMLMTAAGTIPPSRVLVLGAGVAGLQAVATARRLGAVVQAFDIRPAVKEQVESLGATFVGLTLDEAEGAGGYAKEVTEDVQRREHELLARLTAEADVVITTAQVPGKPAPVLITAEMVEAMRPGSVIVDLAAESGGNCPLAEAGRQVVRHDVVIIGLTDGASRHPLHASQMYARNVSTLLLHLVQDGELHVDLEDEITRACCVTHAGEVVHETARGLVGAGR